MKLNIIKIKDDIYGINEDIDTEEEQGFDIVFLGSKKNCKEVKKLMESSYNKGVGEGYRTRPC